MINKEIIDHVLANKCMYIGDQIPESIANDKRAKHIYLGTPDELMNDLIIVINSEISKSELNKLKDHIDSEFVETRNLIREVK